MNQSDATVVPRIPDGFSIGQSKPVFTTCQDGKKRIIQGFLGLETLL